MKNWGRFVCMLLIMCMPQCVVAGIVVASTEYVSGAIDAKTSTKVDTGQVTPDFTGFLYDYRGDNGANAAFAGCKLISLYEKIICFYFYVFVLHVCAM